MPDPVAAALKDVPSSVIPMTEVEKERIEIIVREVFKLGCPADLILGTIATDLEVDKVVDLFTKFMVAVNERRIREITELGKNYELPAGMLSHFLMKNFSPQDAEEATKAFLSSGYYESPFGSRWGVKK